MEPGAGSDVIAITTTAMATPDGDDRVSGEKTSVTMPAHAEAMIVIAKTVRDGEPVGPFVFLVPLDAVGIATRRSTTRGGSLSAAR